MPDRPWDRSDERTKERADILREVMEDQARRAASESREERSSGRRLVRGVYALALVLCGYVWIGSPSWLTVQGPPPPSPAEQEDALRLTIYVQAQQIESFRSREGRIPSSLEEVGARLSGVHYQRTGPTHYRLTGVNDEVTLVYDSSDSLRDFVGDSGEILRPGADR